MKITIFLSEVMFGSKSRLILRERKALLVNIALLAFLVACARIYFTDSLAPNGGTFNSPDRHMHQATLVESNGCHMHQATLVESNGSVWYRIGEIFDPFHVTSIAVVFSPLDLLSPGDDQDVERVLVFGQLIAGLFHNDKVSYVLATVRKSSVIIRLRYTSESGRPAKHWESPLPALPLAIDGQTEERMAWYRLVICTCCVEIGEIGEIELIPPPKKHANTDRTVLVEPVHAEYKSASLCGSTRQRVSAGIMIDSGLYVAGVVDGRATFSTDKIKPFKGQIAVSVCKSSILPHTVSTVTTQGINIESYGSYLNTVVGPVLSLPLSNGEVKRTTTAPRPYVFRFPIVTAASDNHAAEVETMIATAQKVMPERGIIVYNLGLNSTNVKRIRSLCGVTVREFPAHIYPGAIENLFEYRWKPLVVFVALHEFGGAAWADASIRFKEKIDTLPLFQYGHGFVGFQVVEASPVGAFTHDATLKSLGVRRSSVAKSNMTIGTVHVWLSGHKTAGTLLDHWNMCAFHPQCMAPRGAQLYGCKLSQKVTLQYIGCHRYDQSAISVILQKMFPAPFQFDYQTDENADMSRILSIDRQPNPNMIVCVRDNTDSVRISSMAWP